MDSAYVHKLKVVKAADEKELQGLQNRSQDNMTVHEMNAYMAERDLLLARIRWTEETLERVDKPLQKP
jgi:hypothetical protein